MQSNAGVERGQSALGGDRTIVRDDALATAGLISRARSPGHTMASAAFSFPAELIDSIVSFLWSFRLSADERITLMASMSLFNSVWRNAYIRASSKDVYIPCSSYADYYLSILRRESKFYDEETESYFENRCRSITFMIDHPPTPQQGSTINHPTGKAMGDFLYFISDDFFPFPPNLRKIAIHYHNVDFNDIFEHSRLVDFPPEVTELEIYHTFSPEMPRFLLSALRDKDEGHLSLCWRMPRIRHLTLVGVGHDYVANMVVVCGNIETLELGLTYGDPKPELYVVAPHSLRRLILHSPEDIDFSREELSPTSAHVVYLPEVHSRTTTVCVMPTTASQFSNMKRWVDLIELTYPTITWEREIDGERGDDEN